MARKKSYYEGDAFARGDDNPESAAGAAEAIAAIRERLSGDERTVFDLMLEGLDGAAIARRLGKQAADVERLVESIRKVAGGLM